MSGPTVGTLGADPVRPTLHIAGSGQDFVTAQGCVVSSVQWRLPRSVKTRQVQEIQKLQSDADPQRGACTSPEEPGEL